NKSGAKFQDEFSTLTVKWYLHVNVNDTEGNPVPGANVKVTNAHNKTIANRTTDTNGFTGWIACTAYRQNSLSVDYSMNDYNISVSKVEASDYRLVNMTATKTEHFTLDFNSLPSALDLKISKPTVLRTNSIYLYSNGSDIEDIEKNLTPNFEYRDPSEQGWNSSYLSAPQYQNSRWEVTFTPLKTAVLGLYDFRIRFNDTIPALSVWLCINDSLSVLNNIPEFENIFISNDSALLGDSIFIWLNGTDIEDSEENLSIELEYRDPNEISWDTLDLNEPEYLNEKWVFRFNITINALFGYYDFRTRCNDSDGGCSGWKYLNDSLLVYNTVPKVIDIELSGSELYRTELAFLYIEGQDYETPEGMLTFSAQSKHINENEWIDLATKYANNSWEGVFITYPGSALGIYDFRFKFEDNESSSSGWIYHNNTLEVLNNPPVISN
ncbi:MAG: carboxypeptidase regulatory-like domain-containing protein, partial [Thermoplasmata archaeon]|nr:carboxypeptidase regulatory-like domain-containing protein [Thermoplasmata archaeon]